MNLASTPALALSGIHKRFAGVHALSNVDFVLEPGEIHALLGENGAGKSTLIKVMTGAYERDEGLIEVAGKTVAPKSPADAQRLGVSTVYQEVNLLPNLSVAHNLFLGREPRRFGLIQWRKIHREAEALLRQFQLSIDVRRSLGSYSIAIQQLVAIARGVNSDAQVLILDEPTASLDGGEVDILFGILRTLKARGIAIVFVTHFLDQVYAICDRITVLRNGQRVGTFETRQLPRRELIGHMLGRELEALEHSHKEGRTADHRETVLKVEDLSARNGLRAATFNARAGEAIGLSGLLGSGRTEVCETLFGLTEKTEGKIDFDRRPYQPARPAEAIKMGIGLCPEDRKVAGIIGPLSIRENIILALQARRGWWRPLSIEDQREIARKAIEELQIACPGAEKAVAELSGGNQQKVILARWLCTRPKLLILDEPTRGIDIGAHAEILKLIRRLCEDGMTLIVASSEIEELVAFSDQVLVMRDKALATTLNGDSISEASIVDAIAQSN